MNVEILFIGLNKMRIWSRIKRQQNDDNEHQKGGEKMARLKNDLEDLITLLNVPKLLHWLPLFSSIW